MKNQFSLLIIAILSSALFFQCASTQKITSTSESDRNKEVVRTWLEEGWNKKQYKNMIATYFTEDWHDGNPIRPDQMEGHAGVLENVENYLTAFPDIEFDITHIAAEDNLVVVRTEVTATHLGDAFGIPATGKKLNTTSIAIYEMEKGKMKVIWQEFDLLGVLTQMKDISTSR